MKALTARQIIRQEYGNSKNMITPNVIKLGKIDRETAYEISWGWGMEPDHWTVRYTGRRVYAVTIVFWLPTDENPYQTRRAGQPWVGLFDSLSEAEYHIERLKGEDPLYSWTGEHQSIEITLHLSDAQTGSHQGQCDSDIAELLQEDYIKTQVAGWNPDKLRAELKEYGAWEEDELQDHADNCARMLWIICGNIQEEVNSAE